MSEEEYMSFVDGHTTISQSDESEAGIVRNISTLNDRPTIPQTVEKSTLQERHVSVEKNEGKNMETEKYPKNRFDCIEGKTVLTEDDLADIIDFHHEYPDITSLKKYTNKKYRDLTKDERDSLIVSLLNDEEYMKYKNCYIAKSKLLYDSSETLIKEIAALSRLNDLGYEVYLLPYAYARDSMNCYQKSADSITAGDFLEMKSVVSTGERAGQSTYEDARHQAKNIYLSFVNEISEDKIITNIYRSIGNIKRGNRQKDSENDFEGMLFLNFEKEQKTSLYEISKEGRVSKVNEAAYDEFKKIKGTAYASSQVVENPMTEHGSSRNSTIPQSPEKSTPQETSHGNQFLKNRAV